MVVYDAFLTDTARLADVVLPTALWGEKTGTFTNSDRTVHLRSKAVELPGEAQPDMDIFIDFARRLDLRDKDGEPLVKWTTPEDASRHGRSARAGDPVDYSGRSYEKLCGANGIQWPCNDEAPGRERPAPHEDFRFAPPVAVRTTGTTGVRRMLLLADSRHAAPVDAPCSRQPNGRRRTNGTATGTRRAHDRSYRLRLPHATKTGRAPELQAAAPDDGRAVPERCKQLGMAEGDLMAMSPRARLRHRRGGAISARRRVHAVPLRVLGSERGETRRPPRAADGLRRPAGIR